MMNYSYRRNIEANSSWCLNRIYWVTWRMLSSVSWRTNNWMIHLIIIWLSIWGTSWLVRRGFYRSLISNLRIGVRRGIRYQLIVVGRLGMLWWVERRGTGNELRIFRGWSVRRAISRGTVIDYGTYIYEVTRRIRVRVNRVLFMIPGGPNSISRLEWIIVRYL